METEEYIVKTEGLCRRFGETRAVDNLDLAVKHGELFGIVGPDGAGKTTALRILAGILTPTSGNAWVDGISVREYPEKVKEHIAYMPQRFGLYADLTVLENLLFYADLFRVPSKLRGDRIERLFAFSRLGPFESRYAGALSGGMKQKLALACALIHSPRLLLLDEPTNGVDPVSRRDFWNILYDLLREGISIVVSTAYLDEAERTHRVGLMNNGSLIACDEPDVIKSRIGGTFVELVPSERKRSKTVLAEMPQVLDVNIFGEGFHVRIEEGLDPSFIGEELERHGIDVISMRMIEPAMEDAFLWFIAREQAAEASRQGV